MASVQPAREPLEIAMDFIKRINSGDAEAICQLMTADHIFPGCSWQAFHWARQDARRLARLFQDCRGLSDPCGEFFQTGERLAIFGSASGTYSGHGDASSDKFWKVPAAWRVVIRDGLVAEWCVYADNQALRKLMGEAQP